MSNAANMTRAEKNAAIELIAQKTIEVLRGEGLELVCLDYYRNGPSGFIAYCAEESEAQKLATWVRVNLGYKTTVSFDEDLDHVVQCEAA